MYDGEFVRFAGKTDKAEFYPGMQKCLEKLFVLHAVYVVFDKLFRNNPSEQVNVCLYGEGYGPGIQKGGC